MLDIQSLETWLWEAACTIRGPVDAPKFKDYILPLIFLKRLSDVFDDEIERLSAQFGSRDLALRLLEQQRERGQVHLVRFYLPEHARWGGDPSARGEGPGAIPDRCDARCGA